MSKPFLYKTTNVAMMLVVGYLVFPAVFSHAIKGNADPEAFLAKYEHHEGTQPVVLYRDEDFLTTMERAALTEIANQRAGK